MKRETALKTKRNPINLKPSFLNNFWTPLKTLNIPQHFIYKTVTKKKDAFTDNNLTTVRSSSYRMI